MKHGLKQEIRRGLSILMAASMVAGSALPVMAEEVVEEAVEVEVVNEDVAEEADDIVEEAEETAEAEDVVVDVAEVEEAEIAEEVVVEDAADEVVGEYDDSMWGAPSTHNLIATEESTYTLAVSRDYYEKQSDRSFVIYYTCGVPGCTDPTHTVGKYVGKTLPTKDNPVEVRIGTGDGKLENDIVMKVVLEKQTEMDCVSNTEGYEEYALYSEKENNKFEEVKVATDQVNIPVTHTKGTNYSVDERGTCTKPAKLTYNCTKCHKKLEKVEYPAPGHKYKVNYSVTDSKLWSADGTSLTVNVKCENCNNEQFEKDLFEPCGFDENITFTGDQIREIGYKAPTCVETGLVKKYMTPDQQSEALESMIDYVKSRDGYIDGRELRFKCITVDPLKHLNVKLYEEPKEVKGTNYKGHEWKTYTWGNVAWECERKIDEKCSGTLRPTTDRYGNPKFNVPEDSLEIGKYTIVTKVIQKATCNQHGMEEWRIVGKINDGSIVRGTRVCNVMSIGLGDHQYSAEDAAKATCAKPYTGKWICTVCGLTIENEPIYAEHKVVLTKNVRKKASCKETGIQEAYCTVCMKGLLELWAKNEIDQKGATKFGKKQLQEQYDILMEDVSIPKLSHKYVIDKEYWDNGSWVTLSAHCINGCAGEKCNVTKTIPVEEVIEKYATYDTTGKRHYEATLEFDESCDNQHIKLPWKSNTVTTKATEVADEVTLSIANKTVEYTGDRQRVNVAASVVDGGNNVIANVAKEVVVKYYKDPAYTQQFSGEPYTAGTYYVKATLEATKSHKGKTAEAVLKINKKNPTVTVKQSATTVKNTKKNKVNITVSIKDVIGQKGKVTYVADKGITVSKKGIVTIKKGTKKGTYKIKINVAETPNYNGVPRTISIKVK